MTNRHIRMFGARSSEYSNEDFTEYTVRLSDSEESDDRGDTEVTRESDDVDFNLGRVTHAISIIDKKLFEENDEEYEYDPN